MEAKLHQPYITIPDRKINHTLTVNKAIMQQSGLGACVLNHPLAAGRVDCAEVSVVKAKKWSPLRRLAEPIPRNVTHISPLSVAWFRHRKGAGMGGKKRQ